MKKGFRVALLVLLVLLIDQFIKFYIKLHFECQEEVNMFGFEWAKLHFIENEGMAFGITFDWIYGKLLLSVFRILMVVGLIFYIRLLLRFEAPMGFVYSIGLITAGALGNIIDSAFYGLIFNDPCTYHGDGIAQMTAIGQGYGQGELLGGFLHGRVVDMLYFPMTTIHVPEWVPMLGGDSYLFFSPIFNIADASITCGVLCILLFQRRFFRDAMLHEPPAAPTEVAADAAPDELSDEVASGENADTEPTGEVAAEAEGQTAAHSEQPRAGDISAEKS